MMEDTGCVHGTNGSPAWSNGTGHTRDVFDGGFNDDSPLLVTPKRTNKGMMRLTDCLQACNADSTCAAVEHGVDQSCWFLTGNVQLQNRINNDTTHLRLGYQLAFINRERLLMGDSRNRGPSGTIPCSVRCGSGHEYKNTEGMSPRKLEKLYTVAWVIPCSPCYNRELNRIDIAHVSHDWAWMTVDVKHI